LRLGTPQSVSTCIELPVDVDGRLGQQNQQHSALAKAMTTLYAVSMCLPSIHSYMKVKMAKQGSITFLNSGANEPQYLDLTHLGPKHRTGINVKLPSVQTNGG